MLTNCMTHLWHGQAVLKELKDLTICWYFTLDGGFDVLLFYCLLIPYTKTWILCFAELQDKGLSALSRMATTHQQILKYWEGSQAVNQPRALIQRYWTNDKIIVIIIITPLAVLTTSWSGFTQYCRLTLLPDAFSVLNYFLKSIGLIYPCLVSTY